MSFFYLGHYILVVLSSTGLIDKSFLIWPLHFGGLSFTCMIHCDAIFFYLGHYISVVLSSTGLIDMPFFNLTTTFWWFCHPLALFIVISFFNLATTF